MSTIVPLNGRIVVKPERMEQTESGILLAQETIDRDRPEIGTVLVGSDAIPTGTRIVFSMYGYDDVEIDGENVFLVAEPNVLAIIS